MVTLKGHFDGKSIVLDEPATLAVGQAVRVVVGPLADAAEATLKFCFSPFADMTATFMNCDEWDEAVVLHVDSLEAVPDNFVRRPGSAAGQIQMADNFNETPEEFEDYF